MMSFEEVSRRLTRELLRNHTEEKTTWKKTKMDQMKMNKPEAEEWKEQEGKANRHHHWDKVTKFKRTEEHTRAASRILKPLVMSVNNHGNLAMEEINNLEIREQALHHLETPDQNQAEATTERAFHLLRTDSWLLLCFTKRNKKIHFTLHLWI